LKEPLLLLTKNKDSSAKAYVASAELAEEAIQRIHTDKVTLQKRRKILKKGQQEIIVDLVKTLKQYVKTDIYTNLSEYYRNFG
jgi:flagellin-specific chaperone FliS